MVTHYRRPGRLRSFLGFVFALVVLPLARLLVRLRLALILAPEFLAFRILLVLALVVLFFPLAVSLVLLLLASLFRERGAVRGRRRPAVAEAARTLLGVDHGKDFVEPAAARVGVR